MKAFDFEAVGYDGEVYCSGCLPKGIDPEGDEVHPVFAGSEWDYYPSCAECGIVHEYVGLTEIGYRCETERQGPQEGDITTEDHEKWYQDGKLIAYWSETAGTYFLTDGTDCDTDDWREAIRRHCDREKFWPNCWFISDHGNAHLIGQS